MSKHIETPTIGEILNEEFFTPMGLSAYKVARQSMFLFQESRTFFMIADELRSTPL